MSLRYRIAATIFALEAVMVAVVLWVTLGHSMSGTREQMARTDGVTLALLGDLSRVALLTEEYAELQSFIDSAHEQDPRITGIVLADALGRVVATDDLALIGAPVPRLGDEPHRYWRAREVTGGSGRLGLLAVQFSDRPLVEAFRDTRDLALGVAGGGMGAIAVVGLGMGFVLTRRLGRLADAADRVAAGDTATRVDLPGRDEVARVGTAFDSMVGRLAANLEALKAARDRLVRPTEAISEGFALWDAEDRLVVCNGRLREMFAGLGAGLVPGACFADLCRRTFERMADPAWVAGDLEGRLRARLDHHRHGRGLLEIRLRGGRWVGVTEFRTPDGGTVSIYTDLTRAKEREEALQLGEQRLRAIMDSVFDGIVTLTGDGSIESVNAATERIFGRSGAELVGGGVAALFARPPAAPARGSAAGAAPAPDLAALAGRGLTEMVGVRRDGEAFPVEVSVTGIDLHGRRVFIATVRDITARKAAEETILYQASHDPLTGLPNRALFDRRLRAALEHAAGAGERLAVMFLDLDRFKVINDTLGHATGDALLQAVSGRLRAGVRRGDTVARMGGDEFLFVLRGVRRVEDAVGTARHILGALRPPFRIQGHELHLSASIGVSLYPTDGDTADALLKHADAALYRAKARGRGAVQLYKPAMNARALERMTLENDLRRALEGERLALVYQPQVDLASGRVVGVEALLRWDHPRLGPVPPARFVPLAEESGLIRPLGAWVLRRACAQHRAWREAGLRRRLRLAVNVSGRQLQEAGLVDAVRGLLDAAALDPGLLELELTEGALMDGGEDGAATAEALGALAGMGVRLALDDFGTGYASLGCLRRYPIGRVKIDRSFVRGIEANPGDAVLARSIIGMAHGLGLAVTAEGVEATGQLALLRGFGCDEAQGHAVGRPVPPAAVPALVERAAARRRALEPVPA